MSHGSCWRQEIDLSVPFLVNTNSGSDPARVSISTKSVFECPANLEEAFLPSTVVIEGMVIIFFKLIISTAYQMNLTDPHLIHLVTYYNPGFPSRILLSLGAGWFMNHWEVHFHTKQWTPIPCIFTAFYQAANFGFAYVCGLNHCDKN